VKEAPILPGDAAHTGSSEQDFNEADALSLLSALARQHVGDTHSKGSEPTREPPRTAPEANLPKSAQPLPAWYFSRAVGVSEASRELQTLKRPWYATRQAKLIVTACSSAFLVLGAIGLLWWTWPFYPSGSRAVQSQPSAAANTADSTPQNPPLSPSGETVAPPAPTPADVQPVKQAMADCDAEAARNPDALYFLVIPIMPTTETAKLMIPPGDGYASFYLVMSNAAMESLTDGSYKLDPRPFTFSVMDTTTNKVQSWNSPGGLSKYTQEDAAAVSKFLLGFAVAENNTQWSTEYQRRKGNCYWVSVRFRP
jgi:hypothetical protein